MKGSKYNQNKNKSLKQIMYEQLSIYKQKEQQNIQIYK